MTCSSDFRLRLFTLAEELGNVSAACRLMGVDRSTYYRLKRRVDRWGLEALNVRERRRPRMPNEIGPHLEQRIVAFALGHPGLGPRRISAELAREKWAAYASQSTASGASWSASASTPAASASR
jgi:transposase